jgi:hypothetical protein
MDPEPERTDALEAAASQHHGVRVWSIAASSQQDLTDRIALVLGEHMSDDDELHITHAVVQNGSEDRQRRHLMREPETWTELYFEYSAVIVLRGATVEEPA